MNWAISLANSLAHPNTSLFCGDGSSERTVHRGCLRAFRLFVFGFLLPRACQRGERNDRAHEEVVTMAPYLDAFHVLLESLCGLVIRQCGSWPPSS